MAGSPDAHCSLHLRTAIFDLEIEHPASEPVRAERGTCAMTSYAYETLKALNWLAVPGDQWHPAIRGQQSDRWLNLLAVRKLADADSAVTFDLNKGFHTEYAEARVFGPKNDTPTVAKALAGRIAEVADTPLGPPLRRPPRRSKVLPAPRGRCCS